MTGAEAAAEIATWREWPAPKTRLMVPDELPPLPMDLARLLHRLRLRYVRLAGPALLARARDEGCDQVRLLKASAVRTHCRRRSFIHSTRPTSPAVAAPAAHDTQASHGTT
jgi:hypothetical protein